MKEGKIAGPPGIGTENDRGCGRPVYRLFNNYF